MSLEFAIGFLDIETGDGIDYQVPSPVLENGESLVCKYIIYFDDLFTILYPYPRIYMQDQS